MQIFVDRHVQIGNGGCWGHAHRNATDLLHDDVTESHAIVEHDEFECF
jgi:hypothetical protein